MTNDKVVYHLESFSGIIISSCKQSLGAQLSGFPVESLKCTQFRETPIADCTIKILSTQRNFILKFLKQTFLKQ